MRDMANAWCQGRELSLITLVASLTQTWRLTPGVRLCSWNVSSHDGESPTFALHIAAGFLALVRHHDPLLGAGLMDDGNAHHVEMAGSFLCAVGNKSPDPPSERGGKAPGPRTGP